MAGCGKPCPDHGPFILAEQSLDPPQRDRIYIPGIARNMGDRLDMAIIRCVKPVIHARSQPERHVAPIAERFGMVFVVEQIVAPLQGAPQGLPPGGITVSGSVTTTGSNVITAAGPNNASNSWNRRNLFTYADDVQSTHGIHHFSTGVWFQRLNAVFGLCLGWEMYLLIQRAMHRSPTTA